MKLTVIGGGSTYTPELIDGFARLREQLPIDEVWLVDPSEERLSLVGGISQRIFAEYGHPAVVHRTSDVVAGVSDADVVLIQLRIGGQDARHGDETFPHEACCIGQETTGPGGFAKALRTVPVVLSVAEQVRKHAKPDAWIIDFTNPVGIVTRALLTEGHRAVGLCNVAIGFQRHFAALVGAAPDELVLGHVGLNHLTWERSLQRVGSSEDLMPALLAEHLGELAEHVELPEALLANLHMVPSYYLRYFYAHDVVLGEQRGGETRAHAVQEIERKLLALYADESIVTKPEELAGRGGAFYSESAVDLMAALRTGSGAVQAVNLRNNGTLPFLPDDHVIEVSAAITADGPVALPVAPLPDDVTGLISHVAGYERLALDAAIHGGRDRVVRAMLAHPLVGQWDRAEQLTDLLIAGNREYLPWAR
ncbi:MAG TPA: 6-phospho-beta-glucosidase [Plantibacter sp.]|uniref:6-phospho-beta-glucosidase n=1 Tax=unclassified Plantibacter TaxID=2624265 RepID=UPI002C0B1949|nr:6-phospho-beta-glucosidase [Plantibacter sp.]